MKLEIKFLTIALFAIVLAIPLSLYLKSHDQQLKVVKEQNSSLQIQLKSKAKELKKKNDLLKVRQKQTQKLKHQLQSKRQVTTRLASVQAHRAPVAVSSTGAGSCQAYKHLVAQYNWNVSIALAVMHAESQCHSDSNNSKDYHVICYGSRGLFQIGCDSTGGLSFGSMFDAKTNIAQAYRLYSGRGWSPWTTYTSGRYLQYL